MKSNGFKALLAGQSISRSVTWRKLLIAVACLGVLFYTIAALADTTLSNDNQSAAAATTTVAPGTPRFFNYASPTTLGNDSGEPSIGVNWKTGKVLYYGGFSTYMMRVTFDDTVSPARTNWETRNLVLAGTARALGDPILYTDPQTGRTFASQLEGGTKQNTMDYTDDDGETFQPSVGSGISSGVDHQTLGGGPFAPGMSGIDYDRAVYYCAQDVADANCAVSLDGGRTFGPAIPVWTRNQCRGIHGHIKVAPDGTAYVPVNGCGGTDIVDHNDGEQAVAVSENNGLTWEVRQVKGAAPGTWDPSVAIGADGTLYFGYMADGHDANGNFNGSTPHIAVSHDKGKTWVNDVNVGTQLGIKNIAFPAVVAGDAQRAAFAFHGSTTGGNYDDGAFAGVWHLYVAYTFDGGRTWTTVDATPDDPVQRGSICTNGTLCTSTDGGDTRNLLDFFDATIDKQGRVLVGYADGCITQECISGKRANGTPAPNDFTAKAVIARQSGGKSLFSRYDTQFSRRTPAAPQVIAGTNGQATNVTWSTPDDGGSPITKYYVYRGAATGTMALVATLAGDVNSYTDPTSGANNYYSVKAVNAAGGGTLSPRVKAVVLETSCTLPGLTVSTDASDAAPNTPAVPQVNLLSANIAEPYLNGAQKLVFTMQLAGGGALPPNSQWYLIWNRPNADGKHDRDYVAMKTDASGTPIFEYGRVSYPLVYTEPQPNQGNLPTKFGNADAGSYNQQTGTVQITVTRSLLDTADNIGLGKTFTGIEARSFLGRNDNLPINQNTTSDFTGAGSYVVVGNNACLQPPVAPINLTASTTGVGLIQLNWADRSNNEKGFAIERSTSLNSGFARVATVGANLTSYTDRRVTKGVTYYYRVNAYNGTIKSGYSNVAAGRAK